MAEALVIEGAIEGAKWVASTIVTGLLKEGFSYLGVRISSQLRHLEESILPEFQLVVEAAERSSVHKDKFQLWLQKLKDAVYEAEDVLDLYKYQLLKEKVSVLNTRPALKPFKKVARKVKSKLSILSPQKIKLRRSLNKLEVIAAEAKAFRDLLQVPIGYDGPVAQNFRNGGRQPDVTTSFPLHEVFGRKTELDKIIEYLKSASEQEKRYSVITIVGIGGVGKTTLAQLVCKDERVANHFDMKIWVCVSRKLDLSRHTTQMIESSSNEACSFRESLDAMQNKLAELVKSKKVLLVLDDVWWDESRNETQTEWETFLAPLAKSVESGSKVLVTTRRDNLPMVLRSRPEHSMVLKDLEENDILSLFKLYAFVGTNLDGSHLQEELMTIGKQIVRKLYRSPLAAKAVACQLNRTLNVGAWRSALERDNLGDSQQALLWSYQRLDAPLQRCFSYFSLFPKGHKYKAEEMVQLWIAEGFINSSNDIKRMEDIGMEYFDELVSGSFLQLDEEYEKCYNMHDLFHDLAENISKEDCLRIEDGDHVKEIPPTIRRLSIRGDQVEVNNISFNKMENLHTLMIEDGSLSSHATSNLLTATEKYKKLRVLMIEDGVSRGILTKLMANLKHLRFLYFELNGEGEIPAAVGKLYHLQVLHAIIYNGASLPRSLKNLINLRHLFTRDDKTLESLPDIGRLTSLQKLDRFVVKKEKGHDIGQLKNLNELRESLTISNLENVEGKDKASEANLKAKRHLESLHLAWDSNDESEYKRDLDMEVLECLQPHPNLTKLTIEGYKSHMFPSNWLPMDDLRSLKLHKCTALEVLPPICNLFPHCSKLKIFGLSKLRRFASLPQHLKKLVIINCPSLIFISEEEVQKKSIMTVVQSYQLINRELKAEEVSRDCLEVKRLLESEKVDVPEDFMTLATTLQSCERVDDLDLREAYDRCQKLRLEAIFGRREKSELILPSSLQTLVLDHCNITDGALSQSLQGRTSLKSFKLNNISALTTLPAEEVLRHLTALTELKIDGCRWLKSLGGLYALHSLEELEIKTCPCLELEMVMPLQGERGGSCVLPPSLRSIYIKECTTMKSIVLVAGDGNPPNLATLCVEECPSLESLSLSHQTALTSLTIKDCLGLSSLLLNCLESLEQARLKVYPNNCPSISSLPEHLPQSLMELYLDNCPSISSLPEHLPQSLNILKLYNCSSISSLPEHLPQSLRGLHLRDCPSISSLPEHLPQSLGELYLDNCPSISSLPEHLPQSLGKLYLDNCPSISSLPEHLPQSLNILKLYNCSSISSLPEHLPQSLGKLYLENCPSISSLPEHLPQSLGELYLDNCPSISSLPEHLPQSLGELYLDNCPSISSLPEHLPQSLGKLYLDNCPSISSLPEHLPQSLGKLYLDNCPSISSLPEHLPQSLGKLYLDNCPSISSLPEHLPQSLNILKLYNCSSISSLPEHLPQSLGDLYLDNCPSISSLPEHLPQSLGELYLDNCPSISSLPEYLPQSLEAIVIKRCQILEERCRSPNGEDWLKIANIRHRWIIPSGAAVEI